MLQLVYSYYNLQQCLSGFELPAIYIADSCRRWCISRSTRRYWDWWWLRHPRPRMSAAVITKMMVRLSSTRRMAVARTEMSEREQGRYHKLELSYPVVYRWWENLRYVPVPNSLQLLNIKRKQHTNAGWWRMHHLLTLLASAWRGNAIHWTTADRLEMTAYRPVILVKPTTSRTPDSIGVSDKENNAQIY
jgi:hypothetical protein